MNGRPNIHKMRPKNLSFEKARKWYVLVVILVIVIGSICYAFRADITRFWFEMNANSNCEERNRGGSIPGMITVNWVDNITHEERGAFFEKVGLLSSSHGEFGTVHVPVGKEGHWICILASEGIIEYGYQSLRTFAL